MTASIASASVTGLSPMPWLRPVAAMMAVALVAVGILGSAPASSRMRIISTSSAELASRKGVAPTVSRIRSRYSARLRHARVHIRAVSQQSLHQLQLGLTIRNAGHRVFKPYTRFDA